MAKLARIPTRRGDVLILLTNLGSPGYAVATVAVDGQQDFGTAFDGWHVSALSEAVQRARRLVVPDRQIFLVNVDTGEWIRVSSELVEE